MMGNLALAAAAAWVLAFVTCLILADAPARLAARTAVIQGLAAPRPALVNLAATRCRLDGAAYAATILDLAARHYIYASEREPGKLWCTVRRVPSPDCDLAPSERAVLASVSGRTLTGGAPFEALTETCAADVRGTWHPFESAVRAEGREAGLTRRRLSGSACTLLCAGAGGVAALAFLALHPRPHSGLASPAGAAFFSFAVPAALVLAVSLQDRLTRVGAALAAASKRPVATGLPRGRGDGAAAGGAWPGTPLDLGSLAQAVAAGLPVPLAGASPGVHTGIRPGGRRALSASERADNRRPKAAWSSLGGEWRLVSIGNEESSLMVRAWALIGVGAWLGLLAYPASLIGDPTGTLVPAGLISVAAVLLTRGVARLGHAFGLPTEKAFRAQVIARWIEDRSSGDDTVHVPCAALDDGQRCWTFGLARSTFDTLSVGREVNVRVSPRSAKLLSLEPDPDTASPAGTGPRFGDEPGEPQQPPGPASAAADLPLAPTEVAGALGCEVRVFRIRNRRGTMVSYRGNGVSLTLGVSDSPGGFAGPVPPRRGGHPLPGVGDGAWLLNEGRTVVGQAGGLFLKLKLRGSDPGQALDVLPGLAATVASRLAARHAVPRHGQALRQPDGQPAEPS